MKFARLFRTLMLIIVGRRMDGCFSSGDHRPSSRRWRNLSTPTRTLLSRIKLGENEQVLAVIRLSGKQTKYTISTFTRRPLMRTI
jgi:hypothetical protein